MRSANPRSSGASPAGLRSGGYLLLVIAGLHLGGAVLSGAASGGLFHLTAAAVYVLLAAAVARGMVWVAWIAFIAVIAGTAVAIAGLNGPSPVAKWLLWGILTGNVAAAVVLFGAIWSKTATTG